jgi:hypothetical protein
MVTPVRVYTYTHFGLFLKVGKVTLLTVISVVFMVLIPEKIMNSFHLQAVAVSFRVHGRWDGV